MYTNYIQNYLQGDEDAAIEDTLNQWEVDQRMRYEYLTNFIDEFITSEEYRDYLECKKNIIKADAATQYSNSDFTKNTDENIENKKDYPFTEYSKKMFAFIRRFGSYIINENNAEILQKQIKGIDIIKEKISDFKKFTLLYGDQIRRLKERSINNLLDEFCEMFQIDRSKVETKNRKTKERLASFCKMLRTRYTNRKKKYAHIARMITEEIRKDRRAKIGLFYKVEKNEWTVNDLEVVGVGIKNLKSELRPLELEKVPQIQIKDLEKRDWSRLTSTEMFNKQTSVQPVSIEVPKSVSREIPKEEVNKSQKKQIDKHDKLIIPIPRIKNIRKKFITEEGIKSMSELLTQFQKLDELMENHYLALKPEITREYSLDKCFLYKPKTIMFNNYEAGKTYKKMLKVQNVSYETRKFRFLDITTEDAYDALLFKLTPLIGIQKVPIGQSVLMYLTFTPEIDAFILEAKLRFLSFEKETQSYQKFLIDVKCVPKMIQFTISTNDIYFGRVPMWQKKSSYKTITLANNGHIPCRAIIKKVKDPLQMEEILFEDNMSYKSEDLTIIQEILDEVIENIFNHFGFENTCVSLPKESSRTLKVYMKNFEHYGDYLEKHMVEVYDCFHNIIGTHEIVLHGEVIHHFIKTTPEDIDFGCCMVNSVYQDQLNIENTSSNTQAIAVKYPSALTEHVRPNVTNIFLPPHSSRTVLIRLFPRKTIINCSYFKPDYSILEFPLLVSILTNNYTDVPPVKVMIYAIITYSKNIAITPTNTAATKFYPDDIILNLGHCTVYETVTADVVLENKSLAPQIYGFIDLPKCLSITPNYGFGTIPAGTKKTMTLHFHPDDQDLLKKFSAEKCKDFSMNFKISVDMLCNVRSINKPIDPKKLRKTISLVLKELRRPIDNQLQEDINNCMQNIKFEILSSREVVSSLQEQILSSEEVTEQFVEQNLSNPRTDEECEEETEKNEAIFTESTRNSITLKANVIKPLIEVSAQYIEFPDTPCSSYSVIEFEIRALRMEFAEETVFMKNKDLKLPKYEAWFKITSDNTQIRVEPSCGILKNGDSRRIHLIVKPAPPEELVADIAKSFKYAEIYKMRIKEYEEKIQESKRKEELKMERNKKQTKRDKMAGRAPLLDTAQQSKRTSKEIVVEEVEQPDIIIRDSEIIISPQDYFPAEMCYWRSLEPYTISSKLTCIINYESNYIRRQKEQIYIDVFCKVIRPDFILNDLKSQRINFGKVVFGSRGVQHIMLQNIKYDPITVKVSPLDPMGPFRIPYIKSYVVPPECYFKLPIFFEPTDVDVEIEEYLEISSGKTVVPLTIRGIGITCDINFNPPFSIFRLMEATQTYCDECPIRIQNNSDGTVTIIIEKAFEIEGPLKLNTTEGTSNKGMNPLRNTSKGSKSASVNKKASNELTQHEIYSLNEFSHSTESHFDILNDMETITLGPNSFATVIIGFGNKISLETRKENIRDKEKERAKRYSTGTSSSKQLDAEKIYYATKYNFKIRNNFIKDIIFLCGFK